MANTLPPPRPPSVCWRRHFSATAFGSLLASGPVIESPCHSNLPSPSVLLKRLFNAFFLRCQRSCCRAFPQPVGVFEVGGDWKCDGVIRSCGAGGVSKGTVSSSYMLDLWHGDVERFKVGTRPEMFFLYECFQDIKKNPLHLIKWNKTVNLNCNSRFTLVCWLYRLTLYVPAVATLPLSYTQ